MKLIVGTSGWQYRHWRDSFYPPRVPQRAWLEYYAERFATVESNAAFYRLPRAATFSAWAERTPTDFHMAVKASRYLTHVRRLNDPDEPVRLLSERVAELGDKRGPILVQLPPSMPIAIERLARTLDAFPDGWRVAVEFRHRSWFTDDVRRLLADRGAALCLADRLGPVSPFWRTADWTYLRLHAGGAHPSPCYGRQALATWVRRLEELWPSSADAYVYFNNDPRACALRDARLFALAARRSGWSSTRTPAARDVHLAQGTYPIESP